MSYDELLDYYRISTEAEIEMAERHWSQKRRSAAQESLRMAYYWLMKCRGEDLQSLQNRITNLEKTLY